MKVLITKNQFPPWRRAVCQCSILGTKLPPYREESLVRNKQPVEHVTIAETDAGRQDHQAVKQTWKELLDQDRWM